MKSKPHPPEFKTFNDALAKVLTVSRDEMQERLKAEKQSKKPSTKRASGRASGGKD